MRREATPAGDKFLQNLTSGDWASDAYVSMFDVVSFELSGETHTINPYWAVDYDVKTGCGTFEQDGLRLIDGRCLTQGAGEQCADRFLAYQDALSRSLPEQCSSAAGAVATGRRGSMRPGITELCDRQFALPQECGVRHSSFSGAPGQPVRELEEEHGLRLLAGLWRYSNSIFGGSVLRPETADRVEALQLLPSDIAWHSLEFDINRSGQLVLKCVNLVGPEAQVRCGVSNQHWMKSLEEHWAWQHQRLLGQSRHSARHLCRGSARCRSCRCTRGTSAISTACAPRAATATATASPTSPPPPCTRTPLPPASWCLP